MRKWTRVTGSLGVAALAVAGLGSQEVKAQTGREAAAGASAPAVERGVVRLGLGSGSMGSGEGGLAGRLALTWSIGKNRLITVRGCFVEEFVIFGPSPPQNAWDIGVLYGKNTAGKWGYASASAGVAVTGGMRRGKRLPSSVACNRTGYEVLGCALGMVFSRTGYVESPFHTLGIPVEVEAGLTLSSVLGIGISAFGNLNRERSIMGFSLGVVIGRLG